MENLSTPSPALIARLEKAVDFENRLIGGSLHIRAGVRVVSLYRLEEVFMLLHKPHPRMDLNKLRIWIGTVLQDEELSRGIEQVNTAVSEMDKVTQQNAANAQQSASSSEEMLSQAGWMKKMVTELISLVGGSNSGTKERSANTGSSLSEKIRGKMMSPRNAYNHQNIAVPREEETQPEKLIPLEDDDFKDF